MTTREIIENSFNKEVSRIFETKPQIKDMILNHERKSICIENIAAEVRKTEWSDTYKFRKDQIEDLGREYAKTFSKLALQHAEEKLLSAAERDRREREAREMAEMDKIIEEMDKSESLKDV